MDWSKPDYDKVKVAWREDLTELERRRLEAQMLPKRPTASAWTRRSAPRRSWTPSTTISGSGQRSSRHERPIIPELVEQLGIMRFGHRPRVADTFCGSGQIPFEAARLGCDVYASDLNPVACMLTWGASTSSAAPRRAARSLRQDQQELVRACRQRSTSSVSRPTARLARQGLSLLCGSAVPADRLDGASAADRVVSKGYRVIAELVPDPVNKRYEIRDPLRRHARRAEGRRTGTVGREGKFGEAYLIHRSMA